MLPFFQHLRLAFWRAFEHDAFAIAKAAAFSAILTLFPAVLVLASVLSTSQHHRDLFPRSVPFAGTDSAGRHQRAVLQYFSASKPVKLKLLLTTSIFTLWTASGVMISWMEGFRKAYQMPKTWGLVKERMIALLLVVLAGLPMAFASFLVAFGNQIERWTVTTPVMSSAPIFWACGPRCAGSSRR